MTRFFLLVVSRTYNVLAVLSLADLRFRAFDAAPRIAIPFERAFPWPGRSLQLHQAVLGLFEIGRRSIKRGTARQKRAAIVKRLLGNLKGADAPRSARISCLSSPASGRKTGIGDAAPTATMFCKRLRSHLAQAIARYDRLRVVFTRDAFCDPQHHAPIQQQPDMARARSARSRAGVGSNGTR